jgi:zinc D-Ala-D-Ala carboxypeptidase
MCLVAATSVPVASLPPVVTPSVADKIDSLSTGSSVLLLTCDHHKTALLVPSPLSKKEFVYCSGLLMFFFSIIFCKSDIKEAKTIILGQQSSALDLQSKTIKTLPLEDTIKTDHLDTLQYVMGQFEPSIHSAFIKIPISSASRDGMYLRKEAYEAFQKMAIAAKSEKINLKIVSATRNFNAQKIIWEKKWTDLAMIAKGQSNTISNQDLLIRAQKILEYSSMPGTSRHHWGTDIDLNALDNAYFNKGEGKVLFNWLSTHAVNYGFCQPYTANRPSGYKEEKWHWTYMPISSKLTDFCARKLTNKLIVGFQGASTAEAIDIVKKYQLEINPACK